MSVRTRERAWERALQIRSLNNTVYGCNFFFIRDTGDIMSVDTVKTLKRCFVQSGLIKNNGQLT